MVNGGNPGQNYSVLYLKRWVRGGSKKIVKRREGKGRGGVRREENKLLPFLRWLTALGTKVQAYYF